MPTFIDVNPKQLLEDLRYNVIEVIFETKEGTQQTMRCTLVKSLMPDNRDPEKIQQFHNQNEAVLNPEKDLRVAVVTVWDIDKRGWRSFRTDKLISAQLLNVN